MKKNQMDQTDSRDDGSKQAEDVRQTFTSGAQRSQRMYRYDLIPKVAIDRLGFRFTGDLTTNGPTGGAYKYGEGNWEKGLPTSDVINHIIHHITNYQDAFRTALTMGINEASLEGASLMAYVQNCMELHSHRDDDLAGAMWGIAVLMHQEGTQMFHDDKFPITLPDSANTVAPADSNKWESDLCDTLMHMPDDQAARIETFLKECREAREKRRAESNGERRAKGRNPKRNVKRPR